MTKVIITQGRTTIAIPETDVVAMHPFYGPANAKTLREQIRKDGLVEPTSREVALVAHSLYKGDHQIEQEFTQLMKQNYLRAFTGILYDPKTKLAHFIDHPEFDQRSIVDRDNLVKRASESYAQVPFKHLKTGVVPWKQIAKHPYFIAWANGEEGSEKLADLASRHPKKEAYVWVPEVSDLTQPEARIATLNSNWNDNRLDVYAYVHGDDYGYAFAVRPLASTKGASATKK